MNKKRIAGIYHIKNCCNNKLYIGSSINILERWKVHKYQLNKNTHDNKYLQNAWNKYGQNNFEFQIIKLITNLNEIINEEQKYVNNLNVCDRNIGYNICRIVNIPPDNTGNIRNDLRNYNLIKKSQKVYQFNINREFIKCYDSIRQASRELNVCVSNIARAAKGQLKISKGFIWSYERNISDDKFLNLNHPASKKIIQKTKDGEFIKIWDSMNQAANNLGISTSKISMAANGLRKSAYGYLWEFNTNI